MKISEKLLARLKAMPEMSGFFDDGAYLKRTNTSRSWKSHGAWSWSVRDNGARGIGSQWSMSECLKAKRLVVANFDSNLCYETEIIVEER